MTSAEGRLLLCGKIHSESCVGNQLHLMDTEQYNQIAVDKSLFGDQCQWLTDGVEVTVSMLQDGEPVKGKRPLTSLACIDMHCHFSVKGTTLLVNQVLTMLS